MPVAVIAKGVQFGLVSRITSSARSSIIWNGNRTVLSTGRTQGYPSGNASIGTYRPRTEPSRSVGFPLYWAGSMCLGMRFPSISPPGLVLALLALVVQLAFGAIVPRPEIALALADAGAICHADTPSDSAPTADSITTCRIVSCARYACRWRRRALCCRGRPRIRHRRSSLFSNALACRRPPPRRPSRPCYPRSRAVLPSWPEFPVRTHRCGAARAARLMPRSPSMPRTTRLAPLVAVAATLTTQHAFAHAVAGARIFVNTNLIDDPGVSDEANLPLISLQSPDGKSWVTDANVEFDKTITPELGFGVGTDYDWISNDQSDFKKSHGGFDDPYVQLKYRWFLSPEHEFISSVAVSQSFGRAGTTSIRLRLRHHHDLRVFRQGVRRHPVRPDPPVRDHRANSTTTFRIPVRRLAAASPPGPAV